VVRAQRKLLEHTLRQDDFVGKSANNMLHAIIFGIAWSKQGWLYRSVMRDMIDRSTGNRIEKRLITANRATSIPGHPFDVMWDPKATMREDCRYVVWRTISSVGQIKSKKRRLVKKNGVDTWLGVYDNTEHVKSWGVNRREFLLPNEWKTDLPQHVSDRVKNNDVELIEVFDRETDRLYTIANRCVLLRDIRLPYWHGDLPVSCATTTPDVGVLQGISEVQMLKPLQEMLWLLEHQRLDNTRLQMDLVLLIRDTVDDLDEFQMEPGAKWPVRDPSDIQPLNYPQPQLASISDLEMLRGRLQAVAGTAFMSGSGQSSGIAAADGTASGLMSVIEEGNRRVDFRLNLVRSQFYEHQAQQMLALSAQYLEDTVFVPDAQGDPIPVSPDDLAADTYVRSVMQNDSGLKSIRQQMAQMFAQGFASVQGQPLPTKDGMKMPNPMVVIEMLADAADRDPEDLLTDYVEAAPAGMPPGLGV